MYQTFQAVRIALCPNVCESISVYITIWMIDTFACDTMFQYQCRNWSRACACAFRTDSFIRPSNLMSMQNRKQKKAEQNELHTQCILFCLVTKWKLHSMNHLLLPLFQTYRVRRQEKTDDALQAIIEFHFVLSVTWNREMSHSNIYTFNVRHYLGIQNNNETSLFLQSLFSQMRKFKSVTLFSTIWNPLAWTVIKSETIIMIGVTIRPGEPLLT